VITSDVNPEDQSMRSWLGLAVLALASLHAADAAAQPPPSPPAAPDQLTTTAGQRIGFNPAAIIAIADRDPYTGAAVTCIYGLSPPPWAFIKVSESVGPLLARLGIASWFVKLTRPDRSPVWINAAAVFLLRKPLPGEYPADAKSVVFASGLIQAVTQDPAIVKAAVEAAGGPRGSSGLDPPRRR
jgi:hypothetical protein